MCAFSNAGSKVLVCLQKYISTLSLNSSSCKVFARCKFSYVCLCLYVLNLICVAVTKMGIW